ncbi:MAG: GTP cyclohydrolase FolE2 [Deferribacteraceae bacterium]|jgi:GTP cyclohydrolase I|nr:GTP cyclohydrolase FolE2 [Deferribacteraceae bacterium]
MKDMQNQPDGRQIDIDQVGIRDIVYPVTVKDRSKGSQSTVATISMSVNLPHHFKGTHMSRFVEVLNKHRDNISTTSIREILTDMQKSLNADEAHLEMSFKYFIEKKAPVSGQSALMDYDCTFKSALCGDKKDLVMTIHVPVLALCPCSKEISAYGAHNQRSIVSISVRTSSLVWIEELIEYAEGAASSPIYALLKREDEKYVTEKSYENPAFVEDIVRNATEMLDKDERIIWFEVSSTNMESIHNHNAWAVIRRDKRSMS